eukprot:TRINITY_DN1222_c0_g1_i1.p1 TRINITY_DN1222_c0_g1~~TRINITY_DN1222_c0_g1_i1.p1  ORF type:complete len:671 (+),score=192.90 TRINITY_DN1222_c0_g1_i1:80-2092(+)
MDPLRGSRFDLSSFYSLPEIQSWIQTGRFHSIALQFPHYLLHHASSVVDSLCSSLSTLPSEADSTEIEFHILAETWTSPCCVDWLSVMHLGDDVDALIHFGDACFCPGMDTHTTQTEHQKDLQPALPVLYVFTRHPMNVCDEDLVSLFHRIEPEIPTDHSQAEEQEEDKDKDKEKKGHEKEVETEKKSTLVCCSLPFLADFKRFLESNPRIAEAILLVDPLNETQSWRDNVEKPEETIGFRVISDVCVEQIWPAGGTSWERGKRFHPMEVAAWKSSANISEDEKDVKGKEFHIDTDCVSIYGLRFHKSILLEQYHVQNIVWIGCGDANVRRSQGGSMGYVETDEPLELSMPTQKAVSLISTLGTNFSYHFVHPIEGNITSLSMRDAGAVLQRRSVLMEKLKEAESIGLVLLDGSARLGSIVSWIRKRCKDVGKRCYTISIGRPNIPKLANFMHDLQSIVWMGCTESVMMDDRNAGIPMASPFELDLVLRHLEKKIISSSTGDDVECDDVTDSNDEFAMLFNPYTDTICLDWRVWSCHDLDTFQARTSTSLLQHTAHAIVEDKEDIEPQDSEQEEEASKTLVFSNPQELGVVEVEEAWFASALRLHDRTYVGLGDDDDIRGGSRDRISHRERDKDDGDVEEKDGKSEQSVPKIQEGRRGIASHYDDDDRSK